MRLRAIPLVTALGALLFPVAGAGQQDPRHLDAELFYVTGSWVWPIADSWLLGPEIGGGILEQKTFAPSQDDFTGVVHLGIKVTHPMPVGVTAEFSGRLGVGELRSISCSGCLPDAFGALSVAVLVGDRRLQPGSRATIGTIAGTSFLAWSPLFLRLRF